MQQITHRAFSRQHPEALLMLRLIHVNQLTTAEIARMWGRAETAVVRAAEDARRRIASEILSALQRRDETLPLEWEDVVHVCQRLTDAGGAIADRCPVPFAPSGKPRSAEAHPVNAW